LPEDRRHERLVPRSARTTLKFANGELSAGVIDISMSGAALAIDAQPAIGANVLVGATPAGVVRIIDEGIAVEFERPLLAQDFSENIVL
jgi:hypothetical protein